MRYRFVKDNDGHNYKIPADKIDEFLDWVNRCEVVCDVDDIGPWEGRDFDDDRIDSISRWSFEDPKEDG